MFDTIFGGEETHCAFGAYTFHGEVVRDDKNLMLLHESTAQGYIEKGKFEVPRFQKTRDPTWSFPVIAGGKLYLRDQDVLLCPRKTW